MTIRDGNQYFAQASASGRHYSTYEIARRSANRANSVYFENDPLAFVIAACTVPDGEKLALRYMPVFLPRASQCQDAISLGHLGYASVRT